jgi:hypothetical protein
LTIANQAKWVTIAIFLVEENFGVGYPSVKDKLDNLPNAYAYASANIYNGGVIRC